MRNPPVPDPEDDPLYDPEDDHEDEETTAPAVVSSLFDNPEHLIPPLLHRRDR